MIMRNLLSSLFGHVVDIHPLFYRHPELEEKSLVRCWIRFQSPPWEGSSQPQTSAQRRGLRIAIRGVS
jgi:hypothetical protein